MVEWLLENGVDEDERCYMNQLPIDVVGNCCEGDDAREDDRAAIVELLSRPKRPPRPPREPKTHAKLTLEELSRIEHFEIPSDDPSMPPRQGSRRVNESVARCKVTVTWATEWLKSTLESRPRAELLGEILRALSTLRLSAATTVAASPRSLRALAAGKRHVGAAAVRRAEGKRLKSGRR